jgi:hypothetical protein
MYNGIKSNIYNPLPSVKYANPNVEIDRVPMNNRVRYREKYEQIMHTMGSQKKNMKEKIVSEFPVIKKGPLIRADNKIRVRVEINRPEVAIDSDNEQLIPKGKHIISKSEFQDNSQEDMLISDYIQNIENFSVDSNDPRELFKNVSQNNESNFSIYRSNRPNTSPNPPIRSTRQNEQTGKPILDGLPIYQGVDEVKNVSLSIKRVTSANCIQINSFNNSINSLEQSSIASIKHRVITKDTFLDLNNEDVKADRNPTPITYPNPRPYTSPDTNFNNPNPFIEAAKTETDPLKIPVGPSGNVKRMYNDFHNLTVSIIPEPEDPKALKLLESRFYDDVETESTNQPVLIIKNLNDRKKEERYYGTLYHSVSDNTIENQIPTNCGGLGMNLSSTGSIQSRTGLGTKPKNRIMANPHSSFVTQNKSQIGKMANSSYLEDSFVDVNNNSSCELGGTSSSKVYVVNKAVSEGLVAPPWIPKSASEVTTNYGHDRNHPWNALNDKKLMEKCSLTIGDPTSTLMKIKMNPAKKEAFEVFSRPFNKGITKYVPRETNDYTQSYRSSTPVTRSIIPQTIGLKNQIATKTSRRPVTPNTTTQARMTSYNNVINTNNNIKSNNNNNINNNNNNNNSIIINNNSKKFHNHELNDSDYEEAESLISNAMSNLTAT